ncbi:hypothetical protein K435DRAFT_874967 [Dendrothele bispora CBS 962.96]|uniref:Uncharacterized protein n=1 Tax=Dendrothele bispora (strain CBS 962.96) TaxID=1314807 RepID=A0A4V4HBL7_DENBC|nr:hypothetical protein K435DRAFT_874967 [Dendrothele bispora CBS 962.96]
MSTRSNLRFLVLALAPSASLVSQSSAVPSEQPSGFFFFAPLQPSPIASRERSPSMLVVLPNLLSQNSADFNEYIEGLPCFYSYGGSTEVGMGTNNNVRDSGKLKEMEETLDITQDMMTNLSRNGYNTHWFDSQREEQILHFAKLYPGLLGHTQQHTAPQASQRIKDLEACRIIKETPASFYSHPWDRRLASAFRHYVTHLEGGPTPDSHGLPDPHVTPNHAIYLFHSLVVIHGYAHNEAEVREPLDKIIAEVWGGQLEAVNKVLGDYLVWPELVSRLVYAHSSGINPGSFFKTNTYVVLELGEKFSTLQTKLDEEEKRADSSCDHVKGDGIHHPEQHVNVVFGTEASKPTICVKTREPGESRALRPGAQLVVRWPFGGRKVGSTGRSGKRYRGKVTLKAEWLCQERRLKRKLVLEVV